MSVEKQFSWVKTLFLGILLGTVRCSDLHFYLKFHSFNGFFTIINGADQQSNFYISGKLTVKIQSVHKISESIIVEIDFSNTKLPGKRPSMAILTSKI